MGYTNLTHAVVNKAGVLIKQGPSTHKLVPGGESLVWCRLGWPFHLEFAVSDENLDQSHLQSLSSKQMLNSSMMAFAHIPSMRRLKASVGYETLTKHNKSRLPQTFCHPILQETGLGD